MADVTYPQLAEAALKVVAAHGNNEFTAYLKSVYGVDILSNVDHNYWNDLYTRCNSWPRAAIEIAFDQLGKMHGKITRAGYENKLQDILMKHFDTSNIAKIPHTKWVDLYDILYKMGYEIDNPPAANILEQSTRLLLVNKHRYNTRLQGWELLRTIDTTTVEWAQAAVKNSVVNEMYRYTAEQEGKSLVIDSINGSLFD